MMQSKAKLQCQREDWDELRDCQYIRFIKFSSAIDYLKKKLHLGKQIDSAIIVHHSGYPTPRLSYEI